MAKRQIVMAMVGGTLLIGGVLLALILPLHPVLLFLSGSLSMGGGAAITACLLWSRQAQRYEENITDLHRHEHLLIEAEKIANIGTWSIDLDHGQCLWSEGLYRLLEIPQHVKPSYMGWCEAISGTDGTRVIKRLSELRSSFQSFSEEIHFIHKDGSKRILLCTGDISLGEQGKPGYLIGIIQDTTLQRIAQEEVTRLNRDLERRVNERTRELEDANQRLEEANNRLKVLSATDALTGLPNRRSLEDSLKREWKAHNRRQSPLSILMIDIDYFKNYNDSLGHIAGDDCLRSISLALRSCARRPGDLAARFGGEEFVMLLPDTDQNGALDVAHSIKRTISALKLPHPASAINSLVTVSIGLASAIPQSTDSYLGLVEAADHALYESKTRGRNRISHFEGIIHA